MLIGITDEIKRLEYVAWECEQNNPHNLDITYMKRAAKALRAYRSLHSGLPPLPPFKPPI